MELPGRSLEEEDAFLSRLLEAPPESLAEAIDAAMAAKRPRLAARLVALLPASTAGSATEGARKAARWLLVDGQEPPEEAFAGLEEAWAEIRRRRMRRIKHLARRTPRSRSLDGE